MPNPKDKLHAVPPPQEEKIKVSDPKDYAAGLPAITAVFGQIKDEMTLTNCGKTFFSVNQMEGFDCPGCAWPDPDDHRSSLGEYCENGVKAIVEEATEKRVTPDFFKKHSIQEMTTWTDYKIGKSGRLTEPVIRRSGSDYYEPITWESAYQLIADHLHGLENPNEAVFYTSGKASNEAAFLYQLFVRQFGTNNLPDCSNMCHESTGVALSETIGIGKGSVKLEDFYVADLVIVIGQNPGTNHPRMLSALEITKQKGGKIMGINPLKEPGLQRFKNPQKLKGYLRGTSLMDLHVPVTVNGDLALIKAIMYLLLEEEDKAPGTIFDQNFIETNTSYYQEFITDLRSNDFDQLVKSSGVTEAQIRTATQMIRDHKKIIICWAMGITQHENSVNTIREIVNLLLLKGSIGKPGAGACPVRGHSNVQGDRTVGVWEKLKPKLRDALEKNFDFKPPTEDGFHVVDSIRAMAEGKVKFYLGLGGNLLSAGPDTEFTADAFKKCELTVQISTKLNRNHLIAGATSIILPCIGRTEVISTTTGDQIISCENSTGVVQASRGKLNPISKHLRAEPTIIAELAKKVVGDKHAKPNWEAIAKDYDLIRDLIEATIPGFDNYNKRIRNSGGFYLPNGAREGDFKTETGKALFTVNPVEDLTVKEDELIMMTIRSHDQFNTTIYGNDDRYRGIKNGRRVVFMNEYDIKKSGLKPGDKVDLFSYYDNQERVARDFQVIKYDIPMNTVATYFPEANVLVPINSYAKRSYTPAYKSVIIKVARALA